MDITSLHPAPLSSQDYTICHQAKDNLYLVTDTLTTDMMSHILGS